MRLHPRPKALLAASLCLALGCSDKGTSPEGAVAKPPLIAHWAFETATGGVTEDASGHGRNGTLIGSAALADGLSGKALQTKGSQAGVDVADDTAFALPGGFSICLGLKVDAFPSGQAFVFFRGDGRSGLDPYALTVDGPAKLLRFQITGDSSTGASGTTLESVAAPIETGSWFRVTAVFDPKGSKSMALYLDGALIAEKAIGIVPLSKLDPSQSPGLGIGHHAGRTMQDYALNGLIDEVKVYAGALPVKAIENGDY